MYFCIDMDSLDSLNSLRKDLEELRTANDEAHRRIRALEDENRALKDMKVQADTTTPHKCTDSHTLLCCVLNAALSTCSR